MELTQKQYDSKRGQLETLYTKIAQLNTRITEQANHNGTSFSKISELITSDNELAILENRISVLEHELATARIIKPSAGHKNTVNLFSLITVEDTKNNSRETYCFQEFEQSIPNCHILVSPESPIGNALLGHSVGDVVTVHLPKITRALHIMKIQNIEGIAS